MDALKTTLAVLWVAFGIIVYVYVLVCAVDAALSHNWIEGCFWMLTLILFRIIQRENRE